ncbi:hypothetical protein [Mucilaginibacter gracilis]|uniref:hypothetical protein n=1 Tax=Mucilaginibacter gracilis TaxID=423350 RepID=UPI0013C36247|nr:hypothetical protein [Mucilaginibacter gracilis]
MQHQRCLHLKEQRSDQQYRRRYAESLAPVSGCTNSSGGKPPNTTGGTFGATV